MQRKAADIRTIEQARSWFHRMESERKIVDAPRLTNPALSDRALPPSPPPYHHQLSQKK